jgi:hypothetical protein
MTRSRIRHRAAILAAVLLGCSAGASAHAWQDKVLNDDICNDLKRIDVQNESASAPAVKEKPRSVSNTITGVFVFRQNELEVLRAWLNKEGWEIDWKETETNPRGDGTIVAKKPIEPKTAKSPAVRSAPVSSTAVPIMTYACPQVYLIPARRSILDGCCR